MGKELDFEEELIKILENKGQKEPQLRQNDKELLKHFFLGFICGITWNKRFGKDKPSENLHERN